MSDRWDVFVIGAHDRLPTTLQRLGDELSRLSRADALASAELAAALLRGAMRLKTASAVSRSEAETLSTSLRALGADVEIVRSEPSLAFPLLEPELETGRPVAPIGSALNAQAMDTGTDELAARLAQGVDTLGLVDLDGTTAPNPEVDLERGAAASMTPRLEPAQEVRLELDLERAGLEHKPVGMNAPSPRVGGSVASASMAGATGLPSIADSKTVLAARAAPGDDPSASGLGSTIGSFPFRGSPSPPVARPRLLGTDPIGALLFGGALGLAVALLPALEVSRRGKRDRLDPLESELANAIERPLAARAGEIRAPSEIVSDLESAQSEIQGRFLWTWLLVGVPLGLALGSIKRFGT